MYHCPIGFQPVEGDEGHDKTFAVAEAFPGLFYGGVPRCLAGRLCRVGDLKTWQDHAYVEEELRPLERRYLDLESCEDDITQDVHMDEKPTRPGTVKLFGLLAPREDIEPSEFHQYWQFEHGPLAMRTDSWEPHVGHYVQNHVMEEAHRTEPFYLRIAVVWFDDLETFTAWLDSPDLPEIIFPDEENFLNRDELKMVLTREEDIL